MKARRVWPQLELSCGVRIGIIWKLNGKLAKIDKMGGTAEIPVVQILQQISSVIVTDETRSTF